MGVITVYNKGKRSWTPKNVQGLEKDLEPGESAEMEEALGRRFVMAYPRDITTTGIPAVSTSDIARREQSVNDREANLEKWEASLKKEDHELREWDERLNIWSKELEDREAKISEREKELDGLSLTDRLQDAEDHLDGEKKKRGRKPKNAEATESDEETEGAAE